MEKLTMLVIRYQNGDKEAFEEIYKITDEKMRAYAFSLSAKAKDHQLVEDALQETYIKIIRHIGSLKDATKYLGWAKAILRNTIITEMYKESREMEKAEKEKKRQENEQSDGRLRSLTRSLESEVIFRDNLERAVAGMKSLSEVQRETFIKHYIHQTKIEDIARQMGCPEGTVKSRLSIARIILRREVI